MSLRRLGNSGLNQRSFACLFPIRYRKNFIDHRNLLQHEEAQEQKNAEDLLRLLLTTPKGFIFTYVPWAQSLGIPTMAPTVEHPQGNSGTWLVWGVDQGAMSPTRMALVAGGLA